MDDFRTSLMRVASEYWRAAVDPLHHLAWQTFSLFALMLLTVTLVATLLLRYSWVWSKPAIRDARVKAAPHMYQEHLRISPEDYLSLHRMKLNFESDTVRAFVQRDSPRYYVVTIVEHGKPRALVYKEMRLQMPTRKGRAAPGAVQLDDISLTAVRLSNASEDDDEAGSEVRGQYDVYIRQVRWYDVRHWLLHPNREVRIVVWVTLITTTLPTILQMLFG